jgi:hypothetical protein
MVALGEARPKLRYLALNKHKADHSWGSETCLFEHIRQPHKILRIGLTQDKYGDSNAVISTLMKHSADSLLELRFHNVDGLPIEHYPDKVKNTRVTCILCRYKATVLY